MLINSEQKLQKRFEQESIESDTTPSLAKLKLYGKSVLAVAGATLALASSAPASNTANFSKTGKNSISTAVESPATMPEPSVSEPQPALPEESDYYYSDLQVGITTYSMWHEGHENLFGTMSKSGMDMVRLSFVRDRSDTDQAALETQIPLALEKGIEPVVNFCQNKYTPNSGFPKWTAEKAALLPAGVNRVVIENEPNSDLFSDDTVKEHVDLLYRTTQLIRKTRPDLEISGFGLASEKKYDPVGYLERALRYARKKYGSSDAIMDSLSVHFYRKPKKSLELLKQMEKLYEGDIYIDEMGFEVKNSGQIPANKGLATPKLQVKYMKQFLTNVAADPQVKSVLIYHLKNSPDPNDLKTGLITSDGKKLPAFDAVRSLLRSDKLDQIRKNAIEEMNQPFAT